MCIRDSDRIVPTVGQVSSSGQLPQVAAPRFKAHWRMPQRWSQNTVLTPSVRQPWQLICSGRMGALFNSAHSFAVLSRRAWSLWSVARYASVSYTHLLYGLYAVFGMGAQMAVGTVTNLGITFTAAVLAVLSCLSLRFLSYLIPFPNVPASPITPSFSSFSLI